MRPINRIIIHHSESPGGGVEFLRHVHVAEFGWQDVGYHYVICNGRSHGEWAGGADGEIQAGRWPSQVGAHARGHNQDSIGICVIGQCNLVQPTHRQTRALMELCLRICRDHDLPHTEVYGHRDVNPTDCPGDLLYRQIPFIRGWLKWRMRSWQ